MRHKIYLLTIIFLNSIISIGQTPYWPWAKQVIGNDWSIGYDIATDIGSNVYVCGFFIDSAKFDNFSVFGYQQTGFVVKYDAIGVIQWLNTFTSSSSYFTEKILIDNQNNIIVCGRFSGTLTAGSYTLSANAWQNFFLIKFNSSGTVLWAKQDYSTSGNQAISISIDKNDNIYLAGNNYTQTNFGTFVANKIGMFILKYNTSGTPVQLINESGCHSHSVNVSSDNKIYFTGSLEDTTVIGNDTLYPTGFYEYIVIGIDTDTVYTFSNDLLLICYDYSGNVVWNRQAKSKSYDNLTYASVDSFSNLYVCGNIADTIDFWGITQYPLGSSTPFILKVDSLGNTIWLNSGQPISPNGRVYFNDIKSKNNFLYVIGFPWGISSFANMTISSNSSNQNTLVLKLDSAGNGIWPILDSTNLARNVPNAISLDQNENIIITGFFEDSVHFGNNYLNSFGNSSPIMFIAKMSSIPLGVPKNIFIADNFNLNIFPNPTSKKFTMIASSSIAQINILNSAGQVINKIITNGQMNYSLTLEHQGLYFIQTISDKQIITKKISVID